MRYRRLKVSPDELRRRIARLKATRRLEGMLAHDQHSSPRRADAQEWPEPERPSTPAEQAGQASQDLEHPPQAEGSRAA